MHLVYSPGSTIFHYKQHIVGNKLCAVCKTLGLVRSKEIRDWQAHQTFVMNFIFGGSNGYASGSTTSMLNVPPSYGELAGPAAVESGTSSHLQSSRAYARVGRTLDGASHITHRAVFQHDLHPTGSIGLNFLQLLEDASVIQRHDCFCAAQPRYLSCVAFSGGGFL